MTIIDAAAEVRSDDPQRGLMHRLWRNPLFLVSSAILALVVVAAIFAPLLTPWDPRQADAAAILLPPGTDGHPLGTDSAGRDILSRLLYGARTTLLGAAITVSVAFLIGIPFGMAAGYFGGRPDTVMSWISDLIMSIPNLVIVLAFITVVGTDTFFVMLVFGVLFAPGTFRLARSATRAVRKELYIDAAQVAGLSDTRILARHVLRRVRSPLLIQASIAAGVAIVLQSGLDFLGVGDPREPRWGQMINDAFQNIYRAPAMILWPGLAIGITVAALALLGASIRDEVEPGASRSAKRFRARTTTPPPVWPAPDALFAVRGLHVAYGEEDRPLEVVHGVDLTVRVGEVVGVVGESGSGKSQTLFGSLGLLSRGGRITEGLVSFEGRPVVWPGAPKKEIVRLRGGEIGYVPQEPMANLDPSFTIGSQLVEPLRYHTKLGRRAARARVLALLAKVGIPDPPRTFDAYPHEISGGMAQRVLIAGAISCNPRLLVADEPTTALDVTVQAEVLELLRELQAESKMGMLLVTHNLGVVADICDRVVVMQNGVVVEEGEVRRVFQEPQHPYTQMLLSSTLEGAASRLELDAEVIA